VLFVRLKGPTDLLGAVLVGVLAALAMQAKYTAFAAPVALAWYAITHRQFAFVGIVALSVCVALFIGWEGLMLTKYGESHFIHLARGASGNGPLLERVLALIEVRYRLVGPLSGQLGCLAAGVGLFAGAALGVPRRWLAGVACAWCAGFVLVA